VLRTKLDNKSASVESLDDYLNAIGCKVMTKISAKANIVVSVVLR